MILNTVVLILIRIEHLLLLPLQAQLHLLQRFNSVLLQPPRVHQLHLLQRFSLVWLSLRPPLLRLLHLRH